MEVINLASASAGMQPNNPNSLDEEDLISSTRMKKLLGIVGAALMVLGVFFSIVSLPIVGGINYLHNGRGDGVIVLALAMISALLILGKVFRALIVTGALSLGVMCFTLCQLLARLNSARAEISQSNNLFKGLGEAMLATVQIQWGWAPLIAGGFLVLAAGVLRDELHDASGRIVPVSQGKPLIVLAIVSVTMVVATLAASRLTPSFLSEVRIPSLKSEDDNSSNNIFSSRSTTSDSNEARPLSGWQYSENASEMDGKKSTYLSLVAEEKVGGVIKDEYPSLVIQCKEGRLGLYIDTESIVETNIWSNSNKVRVKLDAQQPASQKWSASTDHQALFAPNAAQITKQLSTAQTFLFEFEPFNKSAQVVRFNVAGLNTHISGIAKACPKAKL